MARRRGRCGSCLYVGILLLVTIGCDGDDGSLAQRVEQVSSEPHAGATQFTNQFQQLAEIALEERAEVTNVTPEVRFWGSSELIVADRQERQVRSYTLAGELNWYISDPALSAPIVAVRVADTVIVALDAHNQASLWDTRGRLVRTLPYAPLEAADDIDLLSDSLVLVSGRPVLSSEARTSALMILNVHTGAVVRSFFEPFMTPDVASVSRAAGWVKSSVRGDTIASVFAHSDTIYVHTADGVLLERIPLRIRGFRAVDHPRRRGESFREWAMGFSFMSDIFWLASGEFLVQYNELEHNLPRWHLLAVSREGESRFQMDDAPHLFAASSLGEELVFSSRVSLVTNHLALARRIPQ